MCSYLILTRLFLTVKDVSQILYMAGDVLSMPDPIFAQGAID